MNYSITKKTVFLLLALFLAPRLIYWGLYVLFPEQINIDHLNHHWAAASGLLKTGMLTTDSGEPTSFIEPLYPLFLEGLRLLTGDRLELIILFQILFSIVGFMYFFKLCRLLFKRDRTIFIAMIIYAFYPYLIRCSIKLMEVSFFRVLLTGAAYHSLKASKSLAQSAAAGFLWGLSILTRSMIFPAFIMIVLKLFWDKKIRSAFLVLFLGVGISTPMFIYNHKIDGSWFPTRGGLNFFVGNNPYYGRLMPMYHVDNLESYAYRVLAKERPDLVNASDRLKDQFFYQKSFEFIRKNPIQFLKYKVLNLTYFFMPAVIPMRSLGDTSVMVQDDGSIRLDMTASNFPARGGFSIFLHAASKSFVMVFALFGLWFRRKKLLSEDFSLVSIIVTFISVYTVVWPSSRLYAPAIFVLMFYSAFGFERLIPVLKHLSDHLSDNDLPG